MNLFAKLFIGALLCLLFLSGCTQSPPTPPYSECQWYTQNTDLNCAAARDGDYNGLLAAWDGNKISAINIFDANFIDINGAFLMLNQSTPQHVYGGTPYFDRGVIVNEVGASAPDAGVFFNDDSGIENQVKLGYVNLTDRFLTGNNVIGLRNVSSAVAGFAVFPKDNGVLDDYVLIGGNQEQKIQMMSNSTNDYFDLFQGETTQNIAVSDTLTIVPNGGTINDNTVEKAVFETPEDFSKLTLYTREDLDNHMTIGMNGNNFGYTESDAPLNYFPSDVDPTADSYVSMLTQDGFMTLRIAQAFNAPMYADLFSSATYPLSLKGTGASDATVLMYFDPSTEAVYFEPNPGETTTNISLFGKDTGTGTNFPAIGLNDTGDIASIWYSTSLGSVQFDHNIFVQGYEVCTIAGNCPSGSGFDPQEVKRVYDDANLIAVDGPARELIGEDDVNYLEWHDSMLLAREGINLGSVSDYLKYSFDNSGDGTGLIQMTNGDAFVRFDGSGIITQIGDAALSSSHYYLQVNGGGDAGDGIVSLKQDATVKMKVDGDGVIFSGGSNPLLDDTYDLGTDALRWQDLFLSGSTIHMGTSGNEATISRFNSGDKDFLISPLGDGNGFTFRDQSSSLFSPRLFRWGLIDEGMDEGAIMVYFPDYLMLGSDATWSDNGVTPVTSVNQNTRVLHDGGGIKSFDWGNRTFYDSGEVQVAHYQGGDGVFSITPNFASTGGAQQFLVQSNGDNETFAEIGYIGGVNNTTRLFHYFDFGTTNYGGLKSDYPIVLQPNGVACASGTDCLWSFQYNTNGWEQTMAMIGSTRSTLLRANSQGMQLVTDGDLNLTSGDIVTIDGGSGFIDFQLFSSPEFRFGSSSLIPFQTDQNLGTKANKWEEVAAMDIVTGSANRYGIDRNVIRIVDATGISKCIDRFSRGVLWDTNCPTTAQ